MVSKEEIIKTGKSKGGLEIIAKDKNGKIKQHKVIGKYPGHGKIEYNYPNGGK